MIINNYIIVVIPLKMAQDFLDVAQRNCLRHNISADNPYICRPCARSYKCRNFHQALHFNICASCKSLYICAIHQVYSFTKAANLEAEERQRKSGDGKMLRRCKLAMASCACRIRRVRKDCRDGNMRSDTTHSEQWASDSCTET